MAKPAPPSPAHPLTRSPLLRSGPALALLLAAVTFAAYWPAVGFAFVNYDDPLFVTANPHVLGGPSAGNLSWALDPVAFAYWIPVTWLSYLLDVAVWGTAPLGFHLTNVLLHAANVALFFAVLRRLGGGVAPAAVAALLWGLHPQHVETAAWVSERKGVLSALFGLAAVWAYARYADRPTAGRMAAVAGWTVLSLASKPTLITFPVALLVLDWWPLGRLKTWAELWPRVREKAPLFALALGWAAFAAYTQGRYGALRDEAETPPVLVRAADAVANYGVYVWQAVWPVDLPPMAPRVPQPWWVPVLAAAVLAAVTAGAVAVRNAAPAVLAGWAWFVVGLAPTVGLVATYGLHATADRNTYWPHLGLFAGAVWGAAAAVSRFRPSPVVGVAAGAVLVACAAGTRLQLAHWADSRALWAFGTAVAPDGNHAAFNNFGMALEETGDPEAAAAAFDRAVEARPSYLVARFNKVRALMAAGRVFEAEAAARDALAAAGGQTPDPTKVALCGRVLGDAAAVRGEYGLAAEHYREGLRAAPIPDVRNRLTDLLAHTGRGAEAVEVLAPVWAANPADPDANYRLGRAYAAAGDWPRAAPRLEDAARALPDAALAQTWAAAALLAVGRPADARERAAAAARTAPNWGPYWTRWAFDRATDPDPVTRAPDLAAKIAAAVRLAHDRPPAETLDAEAAAAAAGGRFDAAVSLAEDAARAADAEGKPDLAAAVRGRLALYREKMPFVRPAPPPAPGR